VLIDWNGLEVTKICLKSLNKLIHSPSYKVEIILVDKASTIPVKDNLEDEFPHVYYFRNETNVGFTGGNNTGIRYVIERKSDYILFLNYDTIV
jgi:GT2 family glycosyltransferase